MADLQALVFDLDGVIIDNTPVQARAFQLLFRDLGLQADANELLRRLNGMPATDILEQVFEEPQSEKDLKKYADQREFLYRTLYWDERQPAPGLIEFLEAARAAGLKIGLGSGSANDTLSYILDHLDLRRFFDVVVGAGCHSGRARGLQGGHALRGRDHHPGRGRLSGAVASHPGFHRGNARALARAVQPGGRGSAGQ
ncbi:MAG: hypothetical protein EOO56_09305 [Hymenobacter sp.]|nr:MAG: hypothetical protein EOO56_09305 [Hymenobacter sp.]